MKTIKKRLKILPNLRDYKKDYRAFNIKKAEKDIEFFRNGKINAAYNAVDRHLKTTPDKTALVYIDEDKEYTYTYKQLAEESNRFANVLLSLGVKKGDRVFLFMPRIPELYISFLGTLKIGAICGTLFAAFGPAALQDRAGNAEPKVIVTSPELKKRVDSVKNGVKGLKIVLVTGNYKPKKGEASFNSEMQGASREFKISQMRPKDPAYMLYTSGTTGKPKGVVHTHYDIVHQHMSAKMALDLHPEDTYWCTADPGWVTGIAYGILGPWSNNVTSIVDGRRFNAEKWYRTIDEHKVTVWYTAPTAIRMMMREGHHLTKKYDLSSLRFLASVGEPLNPEAVWWSQKHLKIPFHDNWWQTETGGILIANYASMPIKPGSMGRPLPGIKAEVIDHKGRVLPPGKEGHLAIRPGWPSMMIKIWKNPKKYKEYFKNGWYLSGDKASKDKDGYFWFIGRADDVINTSGHRVGPFEVESALIEHKAVAEAGVIGKPDELRGEIIKAFITLNKRFKPSEALMADIRKFIKSRLAGHAYPREIEFMDKLPKTRSGKIMRRILKAQEMGEDIGDVSTLEDD